MMSISDQSVRNFATTLLMQSWSYFFSKLPHYSLKADPMAEKVLASCSWSNLPETKIPRTTRTERKSSIINEYTI
jgi:hypothetical protein